jgi:hypothetical protein
MVPLSENADLTATDFRNSAFRSPSDFYKSGDVVEMILDPNRNPEADGRSEADVLGKYPRNCFSKLGQPGTAARLVSTGLDRALVSKDEDGYNEDDAFKWLGGGRLTTDLRNATPMGARFEGADLTNVVGLTQAQLSEACVDEKTKLPPGLTLPLRRCLQVVVDREGMVQWIRVREPGRAGMAATWESTRSTVPMPGKPPPAFYDMSSAASIHDTTPS